MAPKQRFGKAPAQLSDDQRVQKWLDWYDRNQQRSEYRRQYYAALTEEQREKRREQKRALYAERVKEGWSGPNRKRTPADNVLYRTLIYSLLIQRDGKNCGICGSPVETGEEGVDHVIPRNMGGLDVAQNIRLTHRVCNNRRPKKPKDIRLLMEQVDILKLN